MFKGVWVPEFCCVSIIECQNIQSSEYTQSGPVLVVKVFSNKTDGVTEIRRVTRLGTQKIIFEVIEKGVTKVTPGFRSVERSL